MIKFDLNKIRIDIVNLKSCTAALGGSVRVLDEKRTAMTGKEVFSKINVPMALIRTFKLRHKTSTYLRPVVTALVYYENQVVAIERHPLGTIGTKVSDGLFGERTWTPDCESNLSRFIEPLVQRGDWFFDGKYIYHFDRPLNQCVSEGKFLTETGNFRTVEVSAIQLSNLDDRTKLEPSIRTCLAFVVKNGQYAVTPPIWKDLGNVGSSSLASKNNESKDGGVEYAPTFQFSEIDSQLCVNLSFALKAGKEVGELFGHESVDPLMLPELMIKLDTVNLPNIPSSVKQTFAVGMKFTHAMAWLIGLTARSNTLDGFLVLRSLLKYLTTKGIFRADMFVPNHVFTAGNDLTTIPLISINQAKENVSNLSIDELIKTIRANANSRKKTNGNGPVGGLYGAD